MISGAIQYGVPTTLARLSCSAVSAAAKPKSASLILPSKSTYSRTTRPRGAQNIRGGGHNAGTRRPTYEQYVSDEIQWHKKKNVTVKHLELTLQANSADANWPGP